MHSSIPPLFASMAEEGRVLAPMKKRWWAYALLGPGVNRLRNVEPDATSSCLDSLLLCEVDKRVVEIQKTLYWRHSELGDQG